VRDPVIDWQREMMVKTIDAIHRTAEIRANAPSLLHSKIAKG
jgi:hypothetical protein